MRRRTGLVPVVVALAAMPVVAGCGSSTPSTRPGSVTVVASTNVWGDVVKNIAGKLAGSTVQITSIISDPDADPHTYEASPKNQLAIARASLVVENGGGYDDFVDTMTQKAGSKATVLNAVDVSGKKAPPGGEVNEHVWYDFPTVRKVAAKVAGALSKADPADAKTFEANGKTFAKKVSRMEATEKAVKRAHQGDGVAITEPVPLYLLQASGLVNRTPEEFSAAIEEDSDVPATVLKKTLDLFAKKQVKLLAYNEQTSGPITKKVLAQAKSSHVPVVPVTETLPNGKDYLGWMRDNLSAISTALR